MSILHPKTEKIQYLQRGYYKKKRIFAAQT
jgi:hypothetical protein